MVALVAAVAIAACGSGGSSSASARRLLQQTFGGHHTVNSGVLSFSLTLTPSGSGASTPISLSLDGPFQSRGAGKLPESNFEIAIDALGHHGRLGLISTGASGYVTLDGAAYQLPAADFQKLASGFSGVGTGSGGGLSKLGIDPLHWVSNPTVVGTATVAGASTTHIRAGVNVASLLSDLNRFLHSASSTAGSQIPSSISAATRQKIEKAVSKPVVDVWTGTSDHTLRKLSLSLEFPIRGQLSSSLGGVTSAALAMHLQYADLNQPQTISAPTDVQPFSSFESKLEGILEQAVGTTSASGSGSGGSSGAVVTGLGKYTTCIQKAGGDVVKMQKCAPLLNGSGG